MTPIRRVQNLRPKGKKIIEEKCPTVKKKPSYDKNKQTHKKPPKNKTQTPRTYTREQIIKNPSGIILRYVSLKRLGIFAYLLPKKCQFRR